MMMPDVAKAEYLSVLVGEGYRRLAARCVNQLVEWHHGITPSLEYFLRNISQDKGSAQQSATAPAAQAASHGTRSRSHMPLENVVDLGLLAIFNRELEAVKGNLEEVAQSGNILSIDGEALSQFMRYIDAGVTATAKPYDKITVWKSCTSLAAAHFFPSAQEPSQELFSRLKVKNVAFVRDLSRIEWDTESQERTLPIPYDIGRCMMYNAVLGVKLIYSICQSELGVQNLDGARVKKSLQLAGADLGLKPRELNAELDAHSEAVLSAVSLAQPHFDAEGIFRKASQFQEADRRGYVLMSVLDTLISTRTAATRSASAANPAASLAASQERLYVYGIGLAELVG